jgi:hypothetical protein
VPLFSAVAAQNEQFIEVVGRCLAAREFKAGETVRRRGY